MTENRELLPCPFCGGKPEFRRSGRQGHYIACIGCDASSNMFVALKDDVRELLIETWNRRAALTAAPDIDADEMERLKKANARLQKVIDSLDASNAWDDALLRDIHLRLQIHGEKYPERMVSVLHRNVVLYKTVEAIRAALGSEVMS